MTWAPFPIAGGCYKDDTLPWSAQDTVNWIPVVAEVQGTRTPVMLRGAPGYGAVYAPAGAAGLPVRGAYDADGFCVVVIGQTLYRFDGTGTLTSLGNMPGVGRLSITHNQITGGSQIVIANGTAGYVYNTADGTFAQITDDGFPGAKSVDYIDSYIVGVEPGGRFWFNSALADATSYNTLDRYEAEAAPDKIVGLIVSHSEVIVFGERTMEFFYDSGANTTTFQRRNGTQTEVGAASQFAIVKLDNTVYWLGNDGLIYRLDGYTPVRISRQPIEQQIARSDLSKCFAMVYEDRGHKIVYFTFPDGLTWGYDVATQEWHRRKSYRLKRWRANCLFRHREAWYVGDYTNGSIGKLDWRINTENGAPLVAERTAPVMASNMNLFRLNAVRLSVDKQASASSNIFALSLAGDIPNGRVGDTVSYQYASNATKLPAGIALTSGTLPAGLSMDKAGRVWGQYTTAANNTWGLTLTDAGGDTKVLADSNTVSLYLSNIWALLGTTNNTTIDFSLSPGAWPISRSLGANFNVIQTSPAWDGTAICLPTSTNGAAAIQVQDAGVSGAVAATVSSLSSNYLRVYGFPGLFIATHASAGTYSYSTDHGATWTTVSGPGSLQCGGIARMSSGRWIALFVLGATQQFYYSDESVPVHWTLATGSISGTAGWDVACDGTTGVFANNTGVVWTTTDGATWTSHSGSYPLRPNQNASVLKALGPGVFLGSDVTATGPHMALSKDGGLTWTPITLAGETSSARCIDQHGDTVSATLTGSQYVSGDLGATWAKSAAAPLSSAVIAYLG